MILTALRQSNGRVYLPRLTPKLALTTFLLTLWCVNPERLEARGLRDTVENLYGGDGILLAPAAPPFSHAPHFIASSLQGLDNLSAALSSSVGILALNSTVAGFTFDIERGIPVRTTESFGPLLTERATTIGARKVNVAFAYSRIDFKRLEGKRLSSLSLDFLHEDTNGDGRRGPPPAFLDFELDQIKVDLNLKIKQDVFAFFATYGLTPRWDVGMVIPIVHMRLRAAANATIIDNSPTTNVHFFDTAAGSDQPRSTGGGAKTGLGDLVLRTKYNFVRNSERLPDFSILGQVKVPTGAEKDLLGTGDTDFMALLIASRSFAPGTEIPWFTPHVNLGFEWTTGSSSQNNLRYVLGFDARVHERVTIAVDNIGRWRPRGNGIGNHIIDLALGAKWNVVREFILNAGVQLPLNKSEGLRPNLIWTVGLEYTF